LQARPIAAGKNDAPPMPLEAVLRPILNLAAIWPTHRFSSICSPRAYARNRDAVLSIALERAKGVLPIR
jgi:hypothetical protein